MVNKENMFLYLVHNPRSIYEGSRKRFYLSESYGPNTIFVKEVW